MLQIIKKSLLSLLLCASISSTAYALGNTQAEKNGSILLPKQKSISKTLAITTEKSNKSKTWDEFKSKHSDWNVLLDPLTQSPTTAFGESIQIEGYNAIDESNIEEASMKFIRENADVINVNPDNLKLQRKDLADGKWFVTYKQYYNGVEVLLSDVQLVIYKTGKVMTFSSKYFNDINISTIAELTHKSAKTFASTNLSVKSNNATMSLNEKPMILPIESEAGVSYKLVYQYKVQNGINRFMSYVDANSGEALWRYNTTSNADINLSASGAVKQNRYVGSLGEVALPNMNVTVGSQSITLDTNGKYSLPFTASSSVSASLSGKYVKVISVGERSSAKFTGTISSAGDFNILFNDNNSHRYERNMFYYANHLIDFFHKLDPSMKVLEKQFYVELQYETDADQTGPNAYSTGDTIVFLDVHLNTNRMADIPGVYFHEFGHSVNKLFYDARNNNSGMINDACNEGTADITSAMILDDRQIGHGYVYPDTNAFLRDCKNSRKYPDDVVGESHNDGQILSGAFWDLKELTDIETLRKLAHYARYSMPDGTDFGTAAFAWFKAVLVADDNDGNLGNGTPHMKQIVTAFNNHNIGLNYFFTNALVHTALKDASADGNAYPVKFGFGSKSIAKVGFDSIYVVYQTKNAKGISAPEKILTSISGAYYTASIPAQAKGTIVNYWFEMVDTNSKSNTKICNFSIKDGYYTFLVGYSRAYYDNFETNTWNSGISSDNATIGMWELGVPKQIKSSVFGLLKPDADNSSVGTKCYITGVSSPSANQVDWYPAIIFQYVPDGTTSITSYKCDLYKLENPVLKISNFYNYYYMTEYGGDIPSFKLEASIDDGSTWTLIKDFSTSTKWQNNILLLSDYINTNSSAIFKFTMKVNQVTNQGYTMANALSVACFDDFEVLTINSTIMTNVNEEQNLANIGLVSPNPFIQSVNIPISFDNSNVNIFNQFGATVYTANVGAGNLNWNGTDMQGNDISSGVYYYTVKSGEKIFKGSIVKIK